MLNIFPKVSGIFVARHLRISYGAACALANRAFWDGLSLRLVTDSPTRTRGARAVTLRYAGLRIRLDRDYYGITLSISTDGGSRKILSGFRDMREVLERIKTAAENYQRPHRSRWAVVPADQYSFTKFQ